MEIIVSSVFMKFSPLVWEFFLNHSGLNRHEQLSLLVTRFHIIQGVINITPVFLISKS